MTAALESQDECPSFSAQLWDVWRQLLDLLIAGPEHTAVGLSATDASGRWRETTNFDADVLVGVGYRLADRDVAEVVPLHAVLALVLAGADVGLVRGVSDVPYLGLAVYAVEDATYLTLVGDPGRFGHLAWSDTPSPSQLPLGMIENVLDLKASSDPVGQQMEDAAFNGVDPDALNRVGQAKKEIRRRYKGTPSDGNQQLRSVTRLAIADGEWPGPEFAVIEIRGDESRYLAGLVYDRSHHRWRSMSAGRADRELSQEAFGATKPGYLKAAQWLGSFEEDFEMPDDKGEDGGEGVAAAKAAEVFGSESVTEYELSIQGTDDIAAERADALEVLNSLNLTEQQIKAWLLSFDHDHRYIADRLDISLRTVGRYIAEVRRQIR